MKPDEDGNQIWLLRNGKDGERMYLVGPRADYTPDDVVRVRAAIKDSWDTSISDEPSDACVKLRIMYLEMLL